MAKNPPKSAAKPDKSGSAKTTAKAETPKAKAKAKPSATSKSKTKVTAAPEPKKAAAKPAAENNSTKVKSDPKKSTPAKPAAKTAKPAAEKAAKATPAAKPAAKAKDKDKVKEVAAAKPSKAAAPKAAKEKAPAKKEKEKAAPAPKVEEAPVPAPAPAPAAKAKKEKAAATAPASKPAAAKRQPTNPDEVDIVITQAYNPAKMPPFYKKQQARLIELRSALLDSLDDVTREAIRTRPEGGDVGGMHMGDAGSDAYDRDFALSMLSKEQDALYEINEALNRLDQGVYGVCELSANKIPEERLEALPYTRYTREMQEQIERDQIGGRYRRPVVRSVFGLDDDDDGDDDDDDSDNSSGSNNDSSLDFGKD